MFYHMSMHYEEFYISFSTELKLSQMEAVKVYCYEIIWLG